MNTNKNHLKRKVIHNIASTLTILAENPAYKKWYHRVPDLYYCRPMTFMQDNAPCHTAKVVKTIMAQNALKHFHGQLNLQI